ncbi:IS5 family transposase [Candidatus Acetothermia bacterium]|nr:IS5 family transposase [Candidatus Acetothermia bacterium]
MANTTLPPRPRRKTVYRIRNWADYDRALVQRGSLTVWIDDQAQNRWAYDGPSQRGAQFSYSDLAIETMLTVREVFHLTNRQTEGLVRSLFKLLDLRRDVPDHTTLSRRARTLEVRWPKQARGPLHLVLDSSGLKVYGEGEWKVRQHGWVKRRTWRKMHLSVDAQSGEIQAALLTEAGVHDAQAVEPLLEQVKSPMASVCADGAYDRTNVYRAVQARAPTTRIVIPPRRDAKIQQHGNAHGPPLPRDENLRAIRREGRAQWKHQSGYHRRSLAKTAVFRLKTIFGDRLSARRKETQVSQFTIRCRALNRMTHLGMPQSHRVG